MAKNSHGAQLRVGDGLSPQTFTPIAALGAFNLPQLSRQAFVVTAHEDGGVRRMPGAVLDVGAIKGELFLDPNDPTHDEATGVIALMLSGDVRDMQIAYPESIGLRYAFSGFLVNTGEQAMNVDGEIKLPFEIAVDDVVEIEADN